MKTSTTLRRSAASALALVATAALAVGCAGSTGTSPSASDASAAPLSGNLIWADYGGPTNESRQIAYFDGFQDKTGVEVVSTSIEDSIYNGMLAGEPGDYDLFQIAAADVLTYGDNLVEVPESSRGDLLDPKLSPYFVGGFYIGIAQGWLTQTFPNGGPQNWADFFDTTKFPGKRAWPGAPGSYDQSFEIALLADGVAPEDLYPIDFERAKKKLDTLRGDMIFYQSYPEVQQLLTSGSAALAVTVTGQYTALERAGQDVTVQWNQAFVNPNGFVIPKNAANPDAALALAAWMRDPKNQAVFTERTLYGPVNKDVFDYLDADVAAKVANSPDHDNVLYNDDQWRADNTTALLDNYTAWLAG
ncbi:extracellular solute-binding protein [Microbacterium rhizomatis]|uniref:Extracellular solute-binding protein n=1 Tax=Microbacterium rhizomatis TaxID=1631477 RepID=A0A5J5J203_9MICO|nr:extracellular solute-binding protein [Microbacterium rhizomatis]KAA9108034.1 extracellular solute-binding protein [Microbacterium rhizomatis]